MKFELVCPNCGNNDFILPSKLHKTDNIDNTHTLVKCKNCGRLERIHGLTINVIRD